MNVIDLFWGYGGFSKGFKQSGFDIKYGIDVWEDAVKTYKYVFPVAVIINDDITNLTGEELLKQQI